MTTYVLPLDDGSLTPELAGDKAATLSRLQRAGFRVPKAFVVTTEAYSHFVHSNRLNLVIEAIWARIDSNNLATFEAASKQIRSLFGQAKLPPEISNPIRYAYNERITMEETVVVRSSPFVKGYADRSFAGLHEAHLNVIGEQAIVDAVARCWSSLWSTRAIAYRVQHNIAPAQVSMGVMVQLMIPARMSGGLFTINPVTGDPEQAIINSVFGLSTMLMDGQGTPDTFVVNSATGEILEEKIATKQIMVTIEGGRLRDVYVDPSERHKPSLSELHVSAIVALGRQLVKAFGAPQDVEWAILNSRLYILQSRPITGNTGFLSLHVPGDDVWPPTTQKEPHPYDLWTLSESGERWPEPVTPLTWSTWAPVLQHNMEATFANLKDDYLEHIQWVKRIYGRIYFNEGALAYVLHEGFGVPAKTLSDSVGTLPDVANRFHNWRWVTLIQRSPHILRQVHEWEDQIKRFERDFSQIDRWVAEFLRKDLKTESDEALWAQARGVWLRRLTTYTGYHTSAASSAMQTYGEVEEQLERWGKPSSVLQSLVTGLAGLIQTEILSDLWSLAHLVNRHELDEFFLETAPDRIMEHLVARRDAAPVLDAVRTFLARHGHRSSSDAEWSHPRWIEDPSFVFSQIANYLRSGSAFNPHEAERRQQQERLDATDVLDAQLNPLQRISFHRLLGQLHKLIQVRDNGQHYLSKLLLPLRLIFATLAVRWVARGWLANPDDIYFLTVPDIEAILVDGEGAVQQLRLDQLIETRRGAWRYWLMHPESPVAVNPDGKPLSLISAIGDKQIVDGVAASSGRATGVARVVLSLKDAHKLNPGDILVTRALDPSWTPLFSIIKGIVLETGGQLSQGAIVAREYGLPAVTSVYGATRRIPDGQRITVDGVAGKVYWG
ncbi:hypothetical protein GC175_15280 [bacterium]|nr:hypothetical protein [bacterium]